MEVKYTFRKKLPTPLTPPAEVSARAGGAVSSECIHQCGSDVTSHQPGEVASSTQAALIFILYNVSTLTPQFDGKISKF